MGDFESTSKFGKEGSIDIGLWMMREESFLCQWGSNWGIDGISGLGLLLVWEIFPSFDDGRGHLLLGRRVSL